MNQCYEKLDKTKAGFIELNRFKQWIRNVFANFPENTLKIISLIELKYIATELEL